MDTGAVLKEHKLKLTNIRKEILELFSQKPYALSYQDFNEQLTIDSDKSTIYRTLKIFEEKGIIHTVLDPNNIEKYALCNHKHCSEEGHQDSHIHFHCNSCENTYCLESFQSPEIQLPQKFKADKTEVLIFGNCDRCF